MTKLPWWLNFIVKILLVQLAISLLVGGWSLLKLDFSLLSLSNRFFMSGVLVILISLAAGMGNLGNRSEGKQIYAQSAGQADLTERTKLMMADMTRVYGLAVVMLPAGLTALLIAVILGQFA